ncbi:RkpR, polysaccharide export protein [Rhizobium sp. XQZ8]|uniref:RkpR, polysaccharide export protein n=1 Tax=Rhizobium populisoli TaxID=2859785 RepID=UPI001CA49AE2|nr:RkpR, polysaccharide export protein [Rhizobium populisoli]MBW6420102.1 RkpR, polysaccharide export protein [Rhizobium populisoli]
MAEQLQARTSGLGVDGKFEAPGHPEHKRKHLQLLDNLFNKKIVQLPNPQREKVDPKGPATSPAKKIEIDANGANVAEKPASRWKFRHTVIAMTFMVMVALPTTLASLYLAFIAANQYHSSASFSVRSISAAQASDILGMFSQASAGSTISDSYVLLDFIMSEKMVQAADKLFDLENMYAPRGFDFFYGIRKDLPIEDKLRYWRSIITVDFDHASGIMNLTVNAFTPEDSQKVAGFIIQSSERLINDLSLTGRNEMLKVAQIEVSLAEARLSDARDAIRSYRDVSQEADPVEGAKLATQIVASLEQQLVKLQTEMSTALTQMGEDTPRIRVMRSQIDSLQKQLTQERQRLGSGIAPKQGRNATDSASGVAGRLQQYDKLETQREFAERAYTSSLAALERARVDANAKQRYLAVFINPTLSELAQYPHRFLNSLLVLLGTLLIWSVAVMGYYNIRDRN